MKDTQEKERKGIFRFINANTIGFAFLIGTFIISMGRVLTINREMKDTDTTVIRLAHWQLEMGFRDALQAVIDEYNQLHKKDGVKVIQMPVTEKVYKQWLNVHLISGTAPDIIEKGLAKMTGGEYTARFFVPLGEFVEDPNPYNKGNELEAIPWRDTFIDGMRGGFDTALQDYYSVPTVFWNTRFFYNKDLLKTITGTNIPPDTLGQLLDYCQKIRAYSESNNVDIIPIAGSSYTKTFFRDKYAVPFTYTYADLIDIDKNGSCQPHESFQMFAAGKISFWEPRIMGWHKAIKSISEQFSKGWMAMDRQQAAFMFVQGKAAMIASGSWDAESLFRQAKFDVDIIKTPLPGEGETFSELKPVRANEAKAAGGAGFALYKFSKNKDWAIDFLKFLTSQKYNEKFNKKANWLPVIVGTEPREKMKLFMPDPKGYDPGGKVAFLGSSTLRNWYEGKLWLYLSDEIPYNEFASNVTAYINDERYGASRVWFDQYEHAKRQSRVNDRLLSVLSIDMLAGTHSPKRLAVLENKYDTSLIRQILSNNGENLPALYEDLMNEPLPQF